MQCERENLFENKQQIENSFQWKAKDAERKAAQLYLKTECIAWQLHAKATYKMFDTQERHDTADTERCDAYMMCTCLKLYVLSIIKVYSQHTLNMFCCQFAFELHFLAMAEDRGRQLNVFDIYSNDTLSLSFTHFQRKRERERAIKYDFHASSLRGKWEMM